MAVRCGNKVHQKDIADAHHHESVAQVRLCYAREFGVKSIQEAEHDAYMEDDWEGRMAYENEMAYERWLENGGPMAEIIWYENEQERMMFGY